MFIAQPVRQYCKRYQSALASLLHFILNDGINFCPLFRTEQTKSILERCERTIESRINGLLIDVIKHKAMS